MLKYIPRKGGIILLHGGYQYTKHKQYVNNTVRWICTNKKKYHCAGALVVENENIIKSTDHKIPGNLMQCLPNEGRNEVATAFNEIKSKVVTCPSTPVKKIFDESVAPLYDQGYNLVTNIPQFNNCKKPFYTERKKKQDVKKLVYTELDEVEIPKKYRYLIFADYISDDRRIIIFCSEEGKRLCLLTEYFIDGTFKSCPKPFKQLIIMHGELGSSSNSTNIVPILYALLSDKSETSYSILYDLIKTKVPNWEPKIFHADFEIGLTNPIKSFFPEVLIRRCYYHFINSIWRKSKTLKIKFKLHKRIVSLCTVLPLLPLQYVEEGFNYVTSQVEELSDDVKLKSFMRYMATTWLKNSERIKEWCIYNERHKTNNYAEGWNSKLNREINKNYVTVSKLLDALEKDISDTKIKIINNENGVQCNKRRKIDTDRDKFIMNAQLQLIHEEISVSMFLEKLR